MADSLVSPHIVWDVVRKHHAFLKKNRISAFSAEKGNLRNKHSFKYSGLAQRKTVSVEEQVSMKEGAPVRRIVLSVAKGNTNQPAISKAETPLEGHKDHVASIKAVNDATYSEFYRPDLRADALARLSALRSSRRTEFANRKAARATRVRDEQPGYDHLEAAEEEEDNE